MLRRRCDGCGVQSQNDGFFTLFYPRVTAPPLHYCPLCQTDRERRSERVGVIVGVLMVALLPVAGLVAGSGETAALARFACWIAVSSLASIILHELGHAAAARIAGLSVLTISLGAGPVQRRWQTGSTHWELRSLPTCGFVRTTLPAGERPRLAGMLGTAGGPAVNALLLVLAWIAIPTGAKNLEAMTGWHALAAVNGLILFLNLIPMSFSANPADRAPQPNDGLLLFMQLFQGRESIERWWWVAIEDEVQRLIESGDLDAADRRARTLRSSHVDHPSVAIALSAVDIARGRTTLAESELRAVLARDTLPVATRARAEARLAEALLAGAGYGDDPDSSAFTTANTLRAAGEIARRGVLEADRLTERAILELPASSRLQLLRGRTLLATGWVEKAKDVLQAAIAGEDTDPGRAKIARWLAVAASLSEDPEEQERYLEMAKRFTS